MGTKAETNYKRAYWRLDPRCFWCQTKTIIHDGRVPYPPSMATLDHLFSANDPRRSLNSSTVLSCHKCNGERGIEQIKDHNNRMKEILEGSDEERELKTLIPIRDKTMPMKRSDLFILMKVSTQLVALSFCVRGNRKSPVSHEDLMELHDKVEQVIFGILDGAE